MNEKEMKIKLMGELLGEADNDIHLEEHLAGVTQGGSDGGSLGRILADIDEVLTGGHFTRQCEQSLADSFDDLASQKDYINRSR